MFYIIYMHIYIKHKKSIILHYKYNYFLLSMRYNLRNANNGIFKYDFWNFDIVSRDIP